MGDGQPAWQAENRSNAHPRPLFESPWRYLRPGFSGALAHHQAVHLDEPQPLVAGHRRQVDRLETQLARPGEPLLEGWLPRRSTCGPPGKRSTA